MAFGDFADLKERACLSAHFDPESADDLEKAGNAVNEAYLTVCSDGTRWDFLEQEGQWTTVAGTDSYTLSSIASAISSSGDGIEEIIAITNDTEGGRLLVGVPWEAFEQMFYSSQDNDPQGQPTHFTRWGRNRLRLGPKPDAVYTMGSLIRYTPAAMTSDSEEPAIPKSHRHQVIVPMAAMLLLEQEGGSETVSDRDRLQARYEAGYKRLREAYGSGKAPTFSVETPTAFDDPRVGETGWFSA